MAYIAVVDFGSSITRLLIVDKQKPQRVVAYACEQSKGISHGVIVDLEKAAHMLKKLLDQVKGKTDYRISRVYCSIAGSSITSVSSHGVVKVRYQEITPYDMDDLHATAEAIILDNQKMIHLLPKCYKVDNQNNIADPLGMYGVRLEGDFHIILVDDGVAKNMMKCFSRVGVEVINFIFMPLGLGESVLYQDEKQQGVVLVDMGEGTTDFVVYYDGTVRYSGSIPLGGGAVTRDLAYKFKIDNALAERLKLAVINKQDLTVGCLEGVNIKEIYAVISARYSQIIKLIEQHLAQEGLKQFINRGYVLCGGASQYPQLSTILEVDFYRSCRLANDIAKKRKDSRSIGLGTIGLLCFIRKMGGAVPERNNACRKAFKMLQRWVEVYF